MTQNRNMGVVPLAWEGSSGFLFPEQLESVCSVAEEEHALMLGVLGEALQQIDSACHDLETCGVLRKYRARIHVAYNERTLAAVLAWVDSDAVREEDDAGWTFLDICENLGIVPEYLRRLITRKMGLAYLEADKIRRGEKAAVISLKRRRKKMAGVRTRRSPNVLAYG